MLHAHAARCPACAAFQADATAITQRLRLAPLEPLPAPVALPPRRRSVGRFAQVGAAAAVAVLAAGIGTLFSNSTGGSTLSARVPRPTAEQLSLAYLDAPRGLPQHPPISFRPRVGLQTGRTDV
jgi:ferric-dicitrate binding protein FerR (iron transport regulator)